ncbi:hypothetical protein [Segetibacter sp. 3557_3]|nr:hypothetical protein [Segetibacter sp. 3557_3]
MSSSGKELAMPEINSKTATRLIRRIHTVFNYDEAEAVELQ